ncbi:MAG: stage II sporulation protein R [Evtepia sp.]|uniref:stage II sporulation protein R n=1 Tax=Evtepia sp. TaxID=2773933 RepID=UPI002A753A45|nr:stage II sporulation protein R [Evtepia sp.]MDY3014474.1 stage II sporulation protein R [Evtepia sp.]
MNSLHTRIISLPWRQMGALFVAFLVCTALWAEVQQNHLADQVIRFHVLANSDTPEDQALKLQVRDKVLAQANHLLEGDLSAEQAEALLRAELPALQETAARAIESAGYTYPVTVTLEDTWFPTRQYDGFSLPAGTYEALRVIIGEGQGKNWWCVVFPSLCMPSVTEGSLETAGLSRKDSALLTEESQPYVIRFKAVEWWENLKHALSSRP